MARLLGGATEAGRLLLVLQGSSACQHPPCSRNQQPYARISPCSGDPAPSKRPSSRFCRLSMAGWLAEQQSWQGERQGLCRQQSWLSAVVSPLLQLLRPCCSSRAALHG